MKKIINKGLIIILLSNIICLSTAHANYYEMPSTCEYDGKVSYDFELDSLQDQIELGYDIYQDPSSTTEDQTNHSNWLQLIVDLINAFDSVKISTPKHVLQDVPFEVKADAFLDPYVNVKFSNSEKGYVGTDKTNLEMNAYKNMTFDYTYGTALVWAHRASGLCSSQAIWVQKEPKITSSNTYYNSGKIKANVTYLIDKYSKAAKDSGTKVKITLKAVSDIYGSVMTSTIYNSTLDNTLSLGLFPTAGGGPYTVKVTINDGNFSKTKLVGSVIVPGSRNPPCESCQPL
jgi:hypothetical protein